MWPQALCISIFVPEARSVHPPRSGTLGWSLEVPFPLPSSPRSRSLPLFHSFLHHLLKPSHLPALLHRQLRPSPKDPRQPACQPEGPPLGKGCQGRHCSGAAQTWDLGGRKAQ